MEINDHPHIRFNPLLGEWIQVSPHRNTRPWQGQVEPPARDVIPPFDPRCYLCPGNARAGGVKNPNYESTFVFNNDFPALLESTTHMVHSQHELLIARTERGTCRVVCFSPRHDLTISKMQPDHIRKVVDVWVDQYASLGADDFINYVLIFENSGVMMGASNPHPHCQIWATATVPNEPSKEEAALIAHQERTGDCLLCAYLKLETELKDRLVCENDEFAAIVPFWAVWPFETIIISKRHLSGMDQLSDAGCSGLADILKRTTTLYDRVFELAFPYSMGFHQRPTDGRPHEECHLHAHFYPPLLRSATIRKFMVGYELLGSPQRDITPESAAARLREMADFG